MFKRFFLRMLAIMLVYTMGFGLYTFEASASEISKNPTTNTVAETTTTINPFKDVKENSYYYDAVLWAVEKGITNGVSDTKFGVNLTCSRAQGITFLWRYKGSVSPDLKELPFEDISRKDYYYDAIRWAVQEQVSTGTAPTTFEPNAELTRGQFITFLWRVAGEPIAESTQNPFSDVSKNAYYYEAVLWAIENGITSGTTPTTFSPNDACMRVQVVTFLSRADDILSQNDPEENPNEEDESLADKEDGIHIEDPSIPVNATEYGLSPENEGFDNSSILQELVNVLASTGGTIYIPAGEYEFEEIGRQTIGSHCVKMRSNITIKGDGTDTILKPIGESYGGLDMFYFNEYVDTGEPIYLENCNFEDFVIDSTNTHCRIYTSAGKGFMFNLFKNCHWKNVTVMNTDGTGFGVDCPIGGSMENCIAINCGKSATGTSPGASGFGIGFGYSEDETFIITNCKSYDNKAFGFFFEHQSRFNSIKYTAKDTKEFIVTNCTSFGSRYGFGGLQAMNTLYKDCLSNNSQLYGYYFENSKNCTVLDSESNNATEASFVILQSDTDRGLQEVNNIIFQNCTGNYSANGAIIRNQQSQELMAGNMILSCKFSDIETNAVITAGNMKSLILAGNSSNQKNTDLSANIEHFVNIGNNWNSK